ncbi:MAG TPA: hypothetical protein VFN88_12905 [Caulobacteraceae bacterium]|nr:hypothetical protein [Caulobacteraceae bacterium]
MTSLGVLAIDALAGVLVLLGLPLALRPGAVSGFFTRGRSEADAADRAGVAAVLRMAGVMMVAFGATICAFANLIAYYTVHPPSVGG